MFKGLIRKKSLEVPKPKIPVQNAEPKQEEKNIQTKVKLVGMPDLIKEKKLAVEIKTVAKENIRLILSYNFTSDDIPITIQIFRKKDEFVPIYEVSISSISKNTEIILEKIRQELTEQVTLGMVEILSTKDTGIVEQRFVDAISTLVSKYLIFPTTS